MASMTIPFSLEATRPRSNLTLPADPFPYGGSEAPVDCGASGLPTSCLTRRRAGGALHLWSERPKPHDDGLWSLLALEHREVDGVLRIGELTTAMAPSI